MKNALTLAQIVLDFGLVPRATLHRDRITAETDTTHSLMLALVALEIVEAHQLPLDRARLLLLALVHDLPEVYAGDADTFGGLAPDALVAKAAREAQALERLREQLGDQHWLVQAIELYERQEVPEARFLRYLDKAMPRLTNALSGGAAVQRRGQGLDELLAHHRKQDAGLAARYPEWVELLGAVLQQAAQVEVVAWAERAERSAPSPAERLATLEALAADLFDGAPITPEEALRSLHGQVVEVQQASLKRCPTRGTAGEEGEEAPFAVGPVLDALACARAEGDIDTIRRERDEACLRAAALQARLDALAGPAQIDVEELQRQSNRWTSALDQGDPEAASAAQAYLAGAAAALLRVVVQQGARIMALVEPVGGVDLEKVLRRTDEIRAMHGRRRTPAEGARLIALTSANATDAPVLAYEVAHLRDQVLAHEHRARAQEDTIVRLRGQLGLFPADGRKHAALLQLTPHLMARIRALGFEPGATAILPWVVGLAEELTAAQEAVETATVRPLEGSDFASTAWMDDPRVWQRALLELVGGRLDHLRELFGDEIAAAALAEGGGDSAWWDNLAAPEQARWLAQTLRARGAHPLRAEPAGPMVWFVVCRRAGAQAPAVESFHGPTAERDAKARAAQLATMWTEVYVTPAGLRVRSGDFEDELAQVRGAGRPV